MKTKRQFFARPPLEKLAPSGLRTAAIHKVNSLGAISL